MIATAPYGPGRAAPARGWSSGSGAKRKASRHLKNESGVEICFLWHRSKDGCKSPCPRCLGKDQAVGNRDKRRAAWRPGHKKRDQPRAAMGEVTPPRAEVVRSAGQAGGDAGTDAARGRVALLAQGVASWGRALNWEETGRDLLLTTGGPRGGKKGEEKGTVKGKSRANGRTRVFGQCYHCIDWARSHN